LQRRHGCAWDFSNEFGKNLRQLGGNCNAGNALPRFAGRARRLAIAPPAAAGNMGQSYFKQVIRRVPFKCLYACLRRSGPPAISLTAALGLSGCVILHPELALGPVDRMIPKQPDHCRAGELSALQGQDFTLIADHQLAGDLRVIWPAQQVSGDLDSTRLNAQVDATGQIKRLFCG
jgi:hypothetical protein